MNPGFPAWQAGVLIQARRPPLHYFLVYVLINKGFVLYALLFFAFKSIFTVVCRLVAGEVD